MNHLLALRDNREHPAGEAKFQGHPRQERIANPTIARQLFLLWECWCWSIFQRPETMPTGTGDDWSGIRQSATEDNPLIPSQAKRWLGEAIWRKEGNSLFLQDVPNERVFLSILSRGTPDFKAVSRH